MPLLVPVAGKLFSNEALTQALADVDALTASTGKTNAVVGSVDSTGASVALVMAKTDGAVDWSIKAAFSHDFTTGGNSFGAGAGVAW
jgi:hypothetical protein